MRIMCVRAPVLRDDGRQSGWGGGATGRGGLGEGAEFHPFVLTARVTGSTAAARQGMSSGRITCCHSCSG